MVKSLKNPVALLVYFVVAFLVAALTSIPFASAHAVDVSAVQDQGEATSCYEAPSGLSIQGADKTELEEAIKASQDARSGIRVSDDGRDVGPNFKYVTYAESQAFEDVVVTAQSVSSDEAAVQSEVDKAVDDLKAAQDVFIACQKPGSKKLPAIASISYDRSSGLRQPAIGGVYAWHVEFAEGSDLSAVTDDDFQIQRKPFGKEWKNSKCPVALFNPKTCILEGQAIPDNDMIGANQWRFAYAGECLVGEFPIIVQAAGVDASALRSAVKAAQDAQTDVKVSQDGLDVDPQETYVTPDEKEALDGAIAAAQAVLANGASKKDQVDAAAEAITKATDAFNSAKKPGAKSSASDADEDYRLVYETAKVTLPDMPIIETVINPDAQSEDDLLLYYWLVDTPITFEFYNSTTQQSEGTYTTRKGVYTYSDSSGQPVQVSVQMLSGVKMTRGHNYIVSVYGTDYMIVNSYRTLDEYGGSPLNMQNYYIRLDKDGQYPTDIKFWDQDSYFTVMKRTKPLANRGDAKRVSCKIPVYLTEDGTVGTYKGVLPGVTIRLTSPQETIEQMSDSEGNLSVSLLEDCNYMVQIVDPTDTYGIAAFPLAVKDHSEDGWPKSVYNHFSCGSVQGLFVAEKGREHDHDTITTSISKKTTVTGVNIPKGSYLINDRTLDSGIVSGLEGKDYEVFIVEAINMYRTELSRLAAGDFKITREVPDGKKVEKVYYVDDAGGLVALDFEEAEGRVVFEMDTLTMHPNVIVFGEPHAVEPDATVRPEPTSNPADQRGKDGTAVGEGASFEAAEAAILASGSEEGPDGTKFSGVQLRTTKQTGNSITLKWAKVKGARSYVVYGNACGKGKKMQKIKELAGNRLKVTKVAGKKLAKGKYYKFIVVACDSGRKVISTSKVTHIATKGGKAGNPTKVTTKAKKGKVALKKGKAFKLRAKQIAAKGAKVSKHRVIKYESTDGSVASVSKAGVLKGKRPGTCYVYAYAQNGVFAKVKVTVKA